MLVKYCCEVVDVDSATEIIVLKFWTYSWQGIEYLIEHQLLDNDPEDIASFLFKGEGLNKTAIGDYLGER